MFQALSAKLQGVFQRLRGKGTLREQDITEALREVRLALLEADVNFKVVKDLCDRIKERAVGQDVLESLTPGQHVVGIVQEELTAVLGEEAAFLRYGSKPPTVIMLVGLQGSGKTTTCGKLAAYVRRQGRRPMLVACDVYRPAAIRQVQVVGESVRVPVHAEMEEKDVLRIAQNSVAAALAAQCDVLILDTAGRLHVDEAMMSEVQALQRVMAPTEVLLVLDSMTGQDAVNVATRFSETLDLTGFILTKLDGDARGGAALSIRAVTGKPIKFAGVGEKMEALEPFHPARMASRILGMGDIVSLFERAQAAVDTKAAEQLERKLKANRFDLEDFLIQMQQVRKMGPLEQLLQAIPGFSGKDLPELPEKELGRMQAIIQSMTRDERRDPDILNGSRRRRIARGSGTTVQEVNQLVKQFDQMRQMFAKMNRQPGRRNALRTMMRQLPHGR